jgi:3-isopropylmalate dehydrogenase
MKKIGIIRGDGIGKEIVDSALEVLQAVGFEADYTDYDLGGQRYLQDETILPDETIAEWKSLDAILLGAVGHPDVTPGIIERGLLLKMRFELDLYVNHRPFKAEGVDIEVIRENTEGVYLNEGGVARKGTPHEVATQGSINTRFGVERLVRYGFEVAKNRKNKRLTLVHKTNVLAYSGDLWRRTVNEVAKEYPEVETSYDHIDAACIHFVERPERYSVIVTDNLFGDIITDLGGAISGGIGLAASANINPNGVSMFEPAHGSAPDIAGQNKANPIATILSAVMMLEHFGETKKAEEIRNAITIFRDSKDHETTSGTTDDIIELL